MWTNTSNNSTYDNGLKSTPELRRTVVYLDDQAKSNPGTALGNIQRFHEDDLI